MEWTIILLAAAAIVLVLRRLALVSETEASELLSRGALIVDVRSAAEFDAGHVPRAINLPLAELPDAVLARVPDKHQVLLLHCLGGGRSAVAKRLLRANGYTRAFNLGSYARAERLAQKHASPAS